MTSEQFKAWRKALDFTQSEAAVVLGLSKSAIVNYEAGTRRGEDVPVVIPDTVAAACEAIAAKFFGDQLSGPMPPEVEVISRFVWLYDHVNWSGNANDFSACKGSGEYGIVTRVQVGQCARPNHSAGEDIPLSALSRPTIYFLRLFETEDHPLKRVRRMSDHELIVQYGEDGAATYDSVKSTAKFPPGIYAAHRGW